MAHPAPPLYVVSVPHVVAAELNALGVPMAPADDLYLAPLWLLELRYVLDCYGAQSARLVPLVARHGVETLEAAYALGGTTALRALVLALPRGA